MNGTDNLTRECNPLGYYSPGEPHVSPALLWVSLVHCYCVIVFGTLGNASALWCVATCTKTRRPMKVLLFSVFLPILVMCLATRPVIGEFLAAHLTCDPNRISSIVSIINEIVEIILVQIELTSIAVIAVVRAAAIWAPHRPKLGIRGAVVLVVVTCIYAILTTLGLVTLMVMGHKDDPQTVTSLTILFFVTITLPALITSAAYILMIFVIQRNKRRLVAFQQQTRVTNSMDQATRATLAVFISTLVFGLPHSTYRLTGIQPIYVSVILEIIYSTHFVVDPLAYVGFNSGYREKVLSSIRKVMQSTTSCGQPKHQKSSTHMQEDTKL